MTDRTAPPRQSLGRRQPSTHGRFRGRRQPSTHGRFRGRRQPRARRPAARRRDIGWLVLGLDAAGALAALVVAPTDAAQGNAQRLMYLHVPAAWTAYLAFAVVLGASVAYLVRREARFDRYARAAGEIGVGATAVAIIAGSIWGRAVWGVWWTWDPRLVSTALLLIVYAAYLAVGRLCGDARLNARRAAVLGIGGFALVPVVHFSVVWWRSLHQPATLLAPNPHPPINALMAATLLLCVAACAVTAVWLFLRLIAGRHAGGSAPDRHAADGAAPVGGLTPTGGRR